jgi:predicted NAD/FAD-dependent oxidoreductase
MADVVIVGGGVAGLVLARLLSEKGATVQLLDKAAYPGGRLSSRTVAGQLVDTGPTGFAVTDPVVADLLQRLAPDALSCEPSDGRWLFSYRSSARAVAVELATGLEYRKALVTRLADVGPCRHVVLTPPAPQVLEIASRSGIEHAGLADISYEKRLLLLATCGPLTALPSDAMSDVFSDVRLVRGRAGAEVAVVGLANPRWSARHFDADATIAEADLVEELRRAIPGLTASDAILKRWRYANATRVHAGDFLQLTQRCWVAGDGFGSVADENNGVERAVRSALSVAAEIQVT